MGVADDPLDANLFRRLQGGNVARVGQGAAQSDVAFKLFVVVVRDVGPGRSVEGNGSVQHHVLGRGPLVNGGGIDVGLEGRTHLPLRLGGMVELGKVEVAPAHHGLDVAGGVINGDQGALHA